MVELAAPGVGGPVELALAVGFEGAVGGGGEGLHDRGVPQGAAAGEQDPAGGGERADDEDDGDAQPTTRLASAVVAATPRSPASRAR